MKLSKILPIIFFISFPNLLFSQTNNQSIAMIKYKQRIMNELSKEEYEFLENLSKLVQEDNQIIDYQKYIQLAKTDNKGIFWYQCAEILSKLPENQQLDIRLNGRLFVANHILTELLKYNPNSFDILVQKVITLNYLVHGYSAFSNGLMITADTEKYENAKYIFNTLYQEYQDTLNNAIELYPNDEWFLEKKQDFEENFNPYYSQLNIFFKETP